MLNGTLPEPTQFERFLLSHHHLEFLLGVLAAYVVGQSIGAHHRYWLLSLGLMLFSLAAGFTVWDVNRMAAEQGISVVDRAELLKTVTEHHSYLFFGLPSFLIILGSAYIDRLDRWHISRTLLFIGDASYAIYLTHSTLINAITVWLAKTWHSPLGVTVLPTMLISVLIGCLVHVFVERPLLHYFNRRISRFKTRRPALGVA